MRIFKSLKHKKEKHTTSPVLYTQDQPASPTTQADATPVATTPASPFPLPKPNEPEAVHIKVSTCRPYDHKSEEEHISFISLQPPPGVFRIPVDVCCVVDYSYKLGLEVPYPGKKATLTVFDIAKYAVLVVCHALTPQDRLSVVIYESHAKEVIGLTYMDEVGKEKMKEAVSKLLPTIHIPQSHEERIRDWNNRISPPEPENTNIWEGLEKGLEILRTGDSSSGGGGGGGVGRVASLFLLTGNKSQGGEVSNFKKYMDTHKLPCIVSTFGFGSEYDSALLKEIALEGRGMFCVCDSTGVKSTFVNAISNMLVVMGTRVTVSLKSLNGTRIIRVLGAKYTPFPGGARVDLSALQYGQNQNFEVNMTIPKSQHKDSPFVEVSLTYNHWASPQIVTIAVELTDRNTTYHAELESCSALFERTEDVITAICDKLPPAKHTSTKSQTAVLQSTFRPPRDFGQRSSGSGGGRSCFDGSCLVLMCDGTQRRVKDIATGDRVRTSTGCEAEIVCVLKTHCVEGYTELVELDGGLLITPYHPIQIDTKWSFPCSINTPTVRTCPAVYSFVLPENSSHTVIINNVTCITLGHDYRDNDVVQHPYFGTRKVVDDLMGMTGWTEGFIEIHPTSVARDEATGLICKILQNATQHGASFTAVE